jgi:hypothetical protein
LCCLSFDLWILITLLVSSNSSWTTLSGVPGKNHRPAATSHWQTLSHQFTSPWVGFELITRAPDKLRDCMITQWKLTKPQYELLCLCVNCLKSNHISKCAIECWNIAHLPLSTKKMYVKVRIIHSIYKYELLCLRANCWKSNHISKLCNWMLKHRAFTLNGLIYVTVRIIHSIYKHVVALFSPK